LEVEVTTLLVNRYAGSEGLADLDQDLKIAFEPTYFSMGNQDVRTTMIYTHFLNRGGKGVRSLADML